MNDSGDPQDGDTQMITLQEPPQRSPYDRMAPWVDRVMLWVAVVAASVIFGIMLERYGHQRELLEHPRPTYPQAPSPMTHSYVIPVTLPFTSDEAVALLESVGYTHFRLEAVKRVDVLCTMAPDGRRLTVEEAMRHEIADALKQLLVRQPSSPLKLPAVQGTGQLAQLPVEVTRWAFHIGSDIPFSVLSMIADARWRNLIDSPPRELSAEDQQTVRTAVEYGWATYRQMDHHHVITLTPPALVASARLVDLTRKVGMYGNALVALELVVLGTVERANRWVDGEDLVRLLTSCWLVEEEDGALRATSLGRVVVIVARRIGLLTKG